MKEKKVAFVRILVHELMSDNGGDPRWRWRGLERIEIGDYCAAPSVRAS